MEGLWVTAMACRYSKAEIIGVDLMPVTLESVPRSRRVFCSFTLIPSYFLALSYGPPNASFHVLDVCNGVLPLFISSPIPPVSASPRSPPLFVSTSAQTATCPSPLPLALCPLLPLLTLILPLATSSTSAPPPCGSSSSFDSPRSDASFRPMASSFCSNRGSSLPSFLPCPIPPSLLLPCLPFNHLAITSIT